MRKHLQAAVLSLALAVAGARATAGRPFGDTPEATERAGSSKTLSTFARGVLGYFAERGRDFLDSFTLDVGLGFIADVDVEAAVLAHAGLGASLACMCSLLPNRVRRLGFDEDIGFLVFHQHSGGQIDPSVLRHRCFLIPLLFTQHKDGTLGPPSRAELPLARWGDVNIHAMLVPVAFRVGISPGELADFFIGWFGFDLPDADYRLDQHEEWRKRSR